MITFLKEFLRTVTKNFVILHVGVVDHTNEETYSY